MQWRQFFTPVKTITADEAKQQLKLSANGESVLLDVRQPREYEKSHIPGAKLIPLPALPSRLDELDPDKKILVYCAVGGRSRAAAQMLSGKGYEHVYNIAGGIKAYEGATALGGEITGLELFTGAETPQELLIVAYSLEDGLRDFYLTMKDKTGNNEAEKLFARLAEIEVMHQEKILREYNKISGTETSREQFRKNIVPSAIEGGLTTEEYLLLFPADAENTNDIIALAMSIETQALDLYLRAADKTASSESREVLNRIASDEQKHLEILGKLIDNQI